MVKIIITSSQGEALYVNQEKIPEVGDILKIKKDDLIKDLKDPKDIIVKKFFGPYDLIKVKIESEMNNQVPTEENSKTFLFSKLPTVIALIIPGVTDFVKIDVHGEDIRPNYEFIIGNSDILNPSYKIVIKASGLKNSQSYKVIIGTSENGRYDSSTGETLPAFNGEIKNI